MNVYPVNISSLSDMKAVCAKIGTDIRALGYLEPKSRMLHVYADDVDYRAAGFMKQEMLARGGDAAVTKHVIDGKAERSAVLIMATPSQLRSFQEKLKAMDIWGLKEFRERLAEVLKGMNVDSWEMVSPAGHTISLSLDTKIMGILNVTPDSFYPESRFDEKEILGRAEEMLSEGAYILDVGAESTRPGAIPVSEEEELERLFPALKNLRKNFPEAIISADTYKPEVARIAACEGADMINDISGFTFGGGMPEVIADMKIPYVLSHIKGRPETMAKSEPYEDIVRELAEYFGERLAVLESAGVKREQVMIDPGLGFGKNAEDNFAVLKDIESLRVWGCPVMVGHSRKRFTGTERLAGTLAVSAMMAGKVSVLRVHDVKENAETLRIASGLRM